jgi:hypothetical protein
MADDVGLIVFLAMPACVAAVIVIGLASRPAWALLLVAGGVALLSGLLLLLLTDDPEPGESLGPGLAILAFAGLLVSWVIGAAVGGAIAAVRGYRRRSSRTDGA